MGIEEKLPSGILLTGYVYVWRKGVLDWGHERD